MLVALATSAAILPPSRVGKGGEGEVSIPMIEYIITGLIALGVSVYLMVALLRPDKF